jgi:hypothetical protein
MIKLIIVFLMAGLLVGCAPQRSFEEILLAKKEACEKLGGTFRVERIERIWFGQKIELGTRGVCYLP